MTDVPSPDRDEPGETAFVTHESFFWQQSRVDFGPWVEGGLVFESPDARRRLLNLARTSGLLDQLTSLVPAPATREELARVHDLEYIDRIVDLSDRDGGEAGEYAAFGPGTYPIAALAAGAVRDGLAWVLQQPRRRAYALVRPPGHHAERARGRGYCIFSNVAVGIRAVQAAGLARRVAVVDIDVHHGNGTEQAFYADAEVLTISVHQDRCYPEDSGFPADSGSGVGRGANVNVPLLPGSGLGAYLDAFDRIVEPVIAQHEPEAIVIAVGYDAGGLDPLGRMLLSAAGYGTLVARLLELSERICAGRLLAVQEGGYSPIHVPFCGLRVLEAMSGRTTAVADPFDWLDGDPAQALTSFQSAQLDEVIAALALAGVHVAEALPRS